MIKLPTIEKDVNNISMEEKYRDKIMLVVNCKLEGGVMIADIVKFLTPEEYSRLEKPDPFPKNCGFWEGSDLMLDGIGVLL